MSELRDKLGTSVNGPEDPSVVFDGDAWERVDWRGCEERVRRLRLSETVEGPARRLGRGLRGRVDDLLVTVSS